MMNLTTEEKAARYDAIAAGLGRRVNSIIDDLAFDRSCDTDDLTDIEIEETLDDKIVSFFEEIFYEKNNRETYDLLKQVTEEQAGIR